MGYQHFTDMYNEAAIDDNRAISTWLIAVYSEPPNSSDVPIWNNLPVDQQVQLYRCVGEASEQFITRLAKIAETYKPRTILNASTKTESVALNISTAYLLGLELASFNLELFNQKLKYISAAMLMCLKKAKI